jgi:ATP-dependent DNA helicase RecG
MKIMDSCKLAGLPTPVIEEDCGGLIVRLFKDNLVEEQLEKLGLNKRQIDALLFFKGKGKILSSEYAERFNVSDRTARTDLMDLVERNFLVKQGDKKQTIYLYFDKAREFPINFR